MPFELAAAASRMPHPQASQAVTTLVRATPANVSANSLLFCPNWPALRPDRAGPREDPFPARR